MSFSQYLRNDTKPSFRKDVGGYDPGNPLNQWAFRSCAFSKFEPKAEIFMLDAMAGPGKFGQMLIGMHKERKFTSKIQISFNDVRPEPLQYLKEGGYTTICSDIRNIRIAQAFDLIVERFGLKDLPAKQIQIALENIRELLKPNGKFVIADMFAVNKSSQADAISVHAAEQRFAGRDENRDGRCFIPTLDDWSSLLKTSGFRVSVRYTKARGDIELSVYKGRFSQNPQDWGMIECINAEIVSACQKNSSFSQDYQVRISSSSEETRISWPYAVIVAEKA